MDKIENHSEAGEEPIPTESEEAPEEPTEEVAPDLESEVERLRQELAEAQRKAEEHFDGWQRARAELANYRRRKEAEWQKRIRMSNAALIAKILPVLDDLERALQTLPPGLENLTWVEGLFMIKRKLDAVLESEGVQPIETAGKSFDPFYHEAITYEEAPGFEEGEIIGQVQRGYVLEDRVIRPAMVRVARQPIPPAEPEETTEPEDAADSPASGEAS
ncbi:MAG: nucleotide exchange factor GrpE [Anaerolineae bacterium]|jgi:molecular chaperone GrpE